MAPVLEFPFLLLILAGGAGFALLILHTLWTDLEIARLHARAARLGVPLRLDAEGLRPDPAADVPAHRRLAAAADCARRPLSPLRLRLLDAHAQPRILQP